MTHGYALIRATDNVALSAAAWAAIGTAVEGFAVAWDGIQPRDRFHGRVSEDGKAALYELSTEASAEDIQTAVRTAVNQVTIECQWHDHAGAINYLHLHNAGWEAGGFVGFGAATVGGANGEIRVVTNNHDSGAGSLRAALETAGAAVVVFGAGYDSTAYIDLLTDIRPAPYKTVLGQTASAPGVFIRGGGFLMDASAGQTGEYIFQHLNIFPGENESSSHGFQFLRGVVNIVIDHCSIAFTRGITGRQFAGFYKGARNMTVSHCIGAWSLHGPDGNGGYGPVFGNGSMAVTLHQNILAHIRVRAPVIGSLLSDPTDSDTDGQLAYFEMVNCVVYNWLTSATHIASDATRADVIGNYFKWGPLAGSAGAKLDALIISTDDFDVCAPESVYVSGNYYDLIDTSADEWQLVRDEASIPHNVAPESFRSLTPFVTRDYPVLSMPDGLQSVLDNAGAFPRHAFFEQVITDVLNGTGPSEIYLTVEDAGGFPALT